MDRLETGFCLSALEAAFLFGQPEIWNSDQGAQFTSANFLDQHGRARARARQRIHRAAMAQS
jgi:hypothetical protein